MPLTSADVRSSFNANAACLYLLCSSVVVLIAASLNCSNYNYWGNGVGNPYNNNIYGGANICIKENAWAVACSAISTAFTLFFVIASLINSGLGSMLAPWFATFLAILWFPGAFVLTFDGPFVGTGNGYFGAWASLLFALMWFQAAALPRFSKSVAVHQEAGPSTSKV